LPALKRVRIAAEWYDPQTNATLGPINARLPDLDNTLTPLDIVAEAGQSDGGDAAFLRERLAFRLRATRPAAAPPADVRFATGRSKTFAATDISLDELAELARAVGRLFADARPLTPGDLTLPDADPAGTVDSNDLVQRL